MIELIIHDEKQEKSYSIRPCENHDKALWIRTQDHEGMAITYQDLFNWIDAGYKAEF